jgi:ATP-dependent Clp protease, protease subunit
MAVKLNSKGKNKANSLVSSGNVDKTSSWSFSSDDGNKILGDPPDWSEYAKWFLGTDDQYDSETKEHYKYPFGKNGKVYRAGLVAIRQRASAQNEDDIYDAAGSLIDKIDNQASNRGKQRYNRSPFARKNRQVHQLMNLSNEDEPTLYIYDEISWFGVDAGEFVKDLNSQTAKNINVRINSPGGSVFDGVTIYNAMRQHKSNIIVHIDGLAGSIASVIAMGGNELRMAKSAYLMIHEPWSIVIGTAGDMRDEADLLDKINSTIAEIYSDKSGIDIDEIKSMMSDETWLKGQDAVDMKFADHVYSDEKEKAQANLFDLSIFANTPDELMADNHEPTEREIERILRDAGCSSKNAKTILAKGYKALRDEDVEPQRDVEPPKKKDRTADLLIRAEMLCPTT